MHPGKYFCTEYEKSKVVADKIALEAAKKGLPIVAVYPGFVYGPGKVTGGNVVANLVISGNKLIYMCFVVQRSSKKWFSTYSLSAC